MPGYSEDFVQCRGKHESFPLNRTISQIRKPKKKTTHVLQSMVPVHAAGEHRPAALFRSNIIFQKSKNHGKRCKEDQKVLLPDSIDPLLYLRRQDQPVMTTQP